jgi:hypothetical protein
MKKAPGSSETSVLTRATQRNDTEDTILLLHLFDGALQAIHFVIKATVTPNIIGQNSNQAAYEPCKEK